MGSSTLYHLKTCHNAVQEMAISGRTANDFGFFFKPPNSSHEEKHGSWLPGRNKPTSRLVSCLLVCPARPLSSTCLATGEIHGQAEGELSRSTQFRGETID